MTDCVLEADRLNKRFGGIQAMRDVSFSIRPGAMTAFLGENGAGKTTTLKTLLGFLKSNSGRFELRAKRIGYVPEQPAFFPWLEGGEILRLTADVFGIQPSEFSDSVRRLCSALSFDARLLRRTVETYSSGNKKKFSYLQSLVLSPELLIVDEPFSALDPVSIKGVRDLFLKLRSEGAALFLSTHMIAEVQKICDEFIIIKNGRIVFQHDLKRLGEEYRLVRLEGDELAPEEISTWSSLWQIREGRLELLLEERLLGEFLRFAAEKKIKAEPGPIDLETVFMLFAWPGKQGPRGGQAAA